MKNIEDTIFESTLPSNPIPVIRRLDELIRESGTNNPDQLLKDARIRRCLYLLCILFRIAPSIYDNLAKEWLNPDQWFASLLYEHQTQENHGTD
jgi:hypothetical protein